MKPIIKYLLLMLLLIPVGLASRKFGMHLPYFVADNAPDAIWAMMVYFMFRVVTRTSLQGLVLALAFSFAIETSQLYHAAWIDAIR